MITIYPDPSNPDELSRIAEKLLAAADDPKDVRLETFGSGPYFVVPDEVAFKVGLTTSSEDEEPKEPVKRGKKRKEPDNG